MFIRMFYGWEWSFNDIWWRDGRESYGEVNGKIWIKNLKGINGIVIEIKR